MFYSSVSNPNDTVIYVVVVMRMNHEVRLVNVQRKSACNHSSTLFSSSHTFSHKAFKSLPLMLTVVSSAKCIKLSLSDVLCMSLMYKLNSQGEVTDPCGRPMFVVLTVESDPFTLTYIFLSLK